MSKRTANSGKGDYWRTPAMAVYPLAISLPPLTRYVEPCAGDGALMDTLALWGHMCIDAVDVMPMDARVRMGDGRHIADGTIITNPPYSWTALQPLLDAWTGRHEMWLLLPWDMLCNLRMQPYTAHVDALLPLGRVSWLENGQGGFENYGWMHFAIEPQHFVLRRSARRNTQVSCPRNMS